MNTNSNKTTTTYKVRVRGLVMLPRELQDMIWGYVWRSRFEKVLKQFMFGTYPISPEDPKGRYHGNKPSYVLSTIRGLKYRGVRSLRERQYTENRVAWENYKAWQAEVKRRKEAQERERRKRQAENFMEEVFGIKKKKKAKH